MPNSILSSGGGNTYISTRLRLMVSRLHRNEDGGQGSQILQPPVLSDLVCVTHLGWRALYALIDWRIETYKRINSGNLNGPGALQGS
jgi:hypothetical protein